MLVLSRSEVEELLDLDELVGALARAHEELSAGATSMPARIAALADSGLLGAMPAYSPSAGLGCKLVTLFPHNTDRPTHQAAIVLFDPENGSPIALMDGTYVTAIRTAAAASLAARLLARDDAKVLALIGTGVQARSHARTFARVRDWSEIRVAGRDGAKRDALAAELGATSCSSLEDAIRGADVVAATTHSAEPVVRAEWVQPGTHVSSVGYNAPGSELDPALVRAATIVIESRDSAFSPPPGGAPELAGVDPASVAELGELISGARPGRRTPVEITLYKSVGVAVQDLAAAALVLAAARERGAGLEIELEEIHA
ncbi:MAG TPA: ornithine cyclodeaminase family protein [Gaiellaceae bacterium]|jgi:alanine dehydrogenase|nr:ornithine cyclodeaminase family protein [Gaiellaceae bacterium]